MSTFVFDDFFESGMKESESPFLTKNSRRWGHNLSLKVSILSAFLLIFSYIFSFFDKFIPISHFFLLLTYFFAGVPALISSIEEVCKFQIDIDVLMTLAAFGSILIGNEKEGALLLVLFAVSGSMEETVTNKAKTSILKFKKLLPRVAHVIDSEGMILQKSLRDIKAGMQILVKVGEMIPLDGKIIEGRSYVNFAHLTGENLPLTRKENDSVPSGAIPIDGPLKIEVTHTSSDSTLSKIIHLVTESGNSKPKLQRWFDKVSQRYALCIITLAALLGSFMPLFFSIPYLGKGGSIYRSLAFLIACSPCALILSLPIAYLSALSASAKKGILLKGGLHFDALAKCKVITFDKTGTLTTGELVFLGVEKITPAGAIEIDEAIQIAAALEKNVLHPIAQAITKLEHSKSDVELENIQAVAGYGIIANYKDMALSIGKPEWVLSKTSMDLKSKALDKIAFSQKNEEIITLLKIQDSLFIFRFKDKLRPLIKKTLQTLKERFNLKLLMLTGDHENIANSLGKEIGIEKIHANLKPIDKLNIISELTKNQTVAMVGDGLNDAPALKSASVGIAMGKISSSLTSESADVILLYDNFEHIPWLFEKAKKTNTIVKENLFIALGIITLTTIPTLMGLIPLSLAVILHEGGTVLVGLNSLRLLKT